MFEFTENFTTQFPDLQKFTDRQLKIFWTPHEVEVEKDVHDVLTNLTESERHGLFTVLKLFTHYEVKAGADWWTGRFMKEFPHHDTATMGSVFGMMELAVHRPFYSKINELLNCSNEGFYTDYKHSPVLQERMDKIDSYINSDNPWTSLAAFSLVEGVILYSSFAFLKHFQSLGKNKLTNIVKGINFSVRDETLHSEAAAYMYRTYCPNDYHDPHIVSNVANEIINHECNIIDMIYEKGDIEGLDKSDLKNFVSHRVHEVLHMLGITDSSISNPFPWFYKGIESYIHNDFFVGTGREYIRSWNETKFIW